METQKQKLEQEPTEISEYTARMLGSLGLYDASLDKHETEEHPEDNRWVLGYD